MKNQLFPTRLLSMTALAAVVFASLLPLDAQARQRSKKTTGPRKGTTEKQVTRDGGNVDKSTTYTSPDGKVSTRDASRSADKTTGTVTGSSTTNLANGKTASSNFTSEKTDTGRATTGVHTGPNGKTSTYDSNSTKTENGFTRETTATGPNGGTATKDVVVTKQDGTTTRTATTTVTPPPAPAP